MAVAAKNPLPGLRARIHIAQKQMGMTDEEYRALLFGSTGKESTREMDQREMVRVLADFVRLGWQPTAPRNAPSPAVFPEGKRGLKPALPLSSWMKRPSNWNNPDKNAMYRKLYALICAHKWNWGYVRGVARNMFQAQKGDVVLEFLTGAELHALVSALQIAANRLQARR